MTKWRITLWLLLLISQQQAEATILDTCNGAFDFYFLIDSSSSVSRNNVFGEQIIPLVRNITMLFVNPLWRVSYITFSTTAMVHLNLSSDRELIMQTLKKLQLFKPSANTNLAPAMAETVHQIAENNKQHRASVVLVITDGRLQDFDTAVMQADVLRRAGASITTIGVGQASVEQLMSVADRPSDDHVFFATNASLLSTFVHKVLSKTCVEISGVHPSKVCLDERSVQLIGRGFNNSVDTSKVFCRFKLDSVFYDTHPVRPVLYNSVHCALPSTRFSGDPKMQISVNGISVISSNVILSVDNCSPEGGSVRGDSDGINAGLIVGILGGLLVAIGIILLCLLWYFWLLICGVRFIKKPKAHVEPEQPADPMQPKKWATVDASYYGGGGIGGIKQVQVQWGSKGSTEEGSKLTKSKDASIIEVIEEPTRTMNPTANKHSHRKTGSCCEHIKKWLSSLWSTVASYRPVKGDNNHIIWCPGPSYYADCVQVKKTGLDRYSRMSTRSTDSSYSRNSFTVKVDKNDVSTSGSAVATPNPLAVPNPVALSNSDTPATVTTKPNIPARPMRPAPPAPSSSKHAVNRKLSVPAATNKPNAPPRPVTRRLSAHN